MLDNDNQMSFSELLELSKTNHKLLDSFRQSLRNAIIEFEETQPISTPLHIILK